MQRFGAWVHAKDGIAFAQGQVQGAIWRHHHRPRTAKRCPEQRCAVWRVRRLARSRPGFDDAGVKVKPAYSLIADVANEQRAVAIDDDAVRLTGLDPVVAYRVSCFDPVDGRLSPLAMARADALGQSVVAPPAGWDHDWVLIMEADGVEGERAGRGGLNRLDAKSGVSEGGLNVKLAPSH